MKQLLVPEKHCHRACKAISLKQVVQTMLSLSNR